MENHSSSFLCLKHTHANSPHLRDRIQLPEHRRPSPPNLVPACTHSPYPPWANPVLNCPRFLNKKGPLSLSPTPLASFCLHSAGHTTNFPVVTFWMTFSSAPAACDAPPAPYLHPTMETGTSPLPSQNTQAVPETMGATGLCHYEHLCATLSVERLCSISVPPDPAPCPFRILLAVRQNQEGGLPITAPITLPFTSDGERVAGVCVNRGVHVCVDVCFPVCMCVWKNRKEQQM